MSIEIAKEQIINFLKSDTPEVIALKGKWGTGKTYLWNHLFIDEAKNERVPIKQYSYVSLFGIKSTDELKNKIAESLTSIKLLTSDATVKSVFSNLVDYIDQYQRKSKSAISGIFDGILAKHNMKINTLPILSDLLYIGIEKSIICLDNLERKISSLQPDEILGLISDLKEQKKCKLILIFNEEMMNKTDKDSYAKLREKIIDKEITISPTPGECANIVFTKPGLDYKLKELTIKLKIRNIRILTKIKKLSQDIISLLSNYSNDIKYRALHSLVLYCYCYYSPQDDLPTIEILETLKLGYMYDDSSDTNLTISDKQWVSTLQDYDYQNTDDFDLIILTGIKHGYFDLKALRIQADLLASDNEKTISRDAFHAAWHLYHDSFENNQEYVVNNIYQSFKDHYSHLSLNDLNSVVTFLRDFKEHKKADELIALYIANKRSDLDKLNPEHITIFSDVKVDIKLLAALKEIHNKEQQKASLEEIFKSIDTKSSWSKKDTLYIKEVSEEDLYDLLKNAKGNDLRAIIKYGNVIIPDKILSVLTKISKESRINELRTDKYLIKK